MDRFNTILELKDGNATLKHKLNSDGNLVYFEDADLIIRKLQKEVELLRSQRNSWLGLNKHDARYISMLEHKEDMQIKEILEKIK